MNSLSIKEAIISFLNFSFKFGILLKYSKKFSNIVFLFISNIKIEVPNPKLQKDK